MTLPTYKISDIDSGNERSVTVAQYRAELNARKPYTAAISAAILRGDQAGVVAAQAAMRAKFGMK